MNGSVCQTSFILTKHLKMRFPRLQLRPVVQLHHRGGVLPDRRAISVDGRNQTHADQVAPIHQRRLVHGRRRRRALAADLRQVVGDDDVTAWILKASEPWVTVAAVNEVFKIKIEGTRHLK